MKRKIKIKMIDYGWAGFVPEKEYIYQLLDRMYDLEFCDDPDYLIDGCFGYDHLNYDCVKILSNGENYVSDLNMFDYAVGHDHLKLGDRYLRVPHYATYPEYKNLGKPHTHSPEFYLNREFCSFVVSNPFADPLRDAFFARLSKYKPVASGGRHLNNVGGPVADKLDFCRGYKFNIAFENSISPGYVTEKIMQAYAAETVPIYYGDPMVATDFNPDSMVIVKGPEDVERAVEEIIRLDTNDDEYLARCMATPTSISVDQYEKEYMAFLAHIIEQPLEQAKRLSPFGLQADRRKALKRMHDEDVMLHKPINTLKKIKRYLWRMAGMTR